jgi:hypothetical protein
LQTVAAIDVRIDISHRSDGGSRTGHCICRGC